MLPSAPTQALCGGAPGGARCSPHLRGPLPLPRLLRQALVGRGRSTLLINTAWLSLGAVTQSLLVTPLKAVYSARHPVQEADRRGLCLAFAPLSCSLLT